MSKSNLLLWLLASWLLTTTIGCQVNRDITAPNGFLPSGPVKVAKEAYGGWMVAMQNQSGTLTPVQGELITIHDDTVYILSQSQLNAIPVSAVSHAKLELHYQNALGYTLWSVAGGLSTLSHGFGLIYTAPMWLISGLSVSSSAARQPNIIHFPQTGLDEFKKFSRFPQGRPADVDLRKLEPKPLTR